MNQPDLGNYISNLRKEQGLTQEELVEKCNINVRTIQRIEAGEVTPRSYTVKNILEALGTSIDDVFKKEEKKEKTISIIYNKSLLGWGIVAGIIYLILGTFNVTLLIMESFEDAVIAPGAFILSIVFEFIAITVFLIAIAHYGNSNNNSLIKNTAYGAIGYLAAFYFLETLFYSDILDDQEGLGLVLNFSSLFLYGLMYFFLGLGFFTDRNKLGELCKWIGITGMVGGLSFCLIILFPVGIIATLAFEVMLIILLYKAWDVLNKKSLDQ